MRIVKLGDPKRVKVRKPATAPVGTPVRARPRPRIPFERRNDPDRPRRQQLRQLARTPNGQERLLIYLINHGYFDRFTDN